MQGCLKNRPDAGPILARRARLDFDNRSDNGRATLFFFHANLNVLRWVVGSRGGRFLRRLGGQLELGFCLEWILARSEFRHGAWMAHSITGSTVLQADQTFSCTEQSQEAHKIIPSV